MHRRTLGIVYKNDGSAIIEFAIVAPLFFLIFFGVTEFGLYMYHKVVIESIAVDVSRIAAIGKESDSVCNGLSSRVEYVKCVVKNKTYGLVNRDKIIIQSNTISSGGALPPDICMDDPNNPSSEPATCTIYEEINGSGGYQGAGSVKLGSAGELIEFRVSYPWKVQFPLLGQFFGSSAHKGISMITAATAIKNEPFPN